jgi:hypothetical protein
MSFNFEPIIKAIFDPKSRLSTKAAILIVTIIMFFIVDGIFGYSYFYFSNRKIEQIDKISALLKDTTLDLETKNELIRQRKNVIEHRRLTDNFMPFLKNTNISKALENSVTKEGKKRNLFWFHLTAGGFFYIMSFLYIPAIFFINKRSVIIDFVSGIFHSVLLFSLGYLLSWGGSFIPPIAASTWFWNYALNLVLQLGFIAIGISMAEELFDKDLPVSTSTTT